MSLDSRYGMTLRKYPGYELTVERIRAQKNYAALDACLGNHLKEGSPIFLDKLSENALCEKLRQGENRRTMKLIFIILAVISLVCFLFVAFTPGTSAGDISVPASMLGGSVIGVVAMTFDEKSADRAIEAVQKGNYQAYEYTVTDRMWRVVTSSDSSDEKNFYIAVNGVIVEVSEGFYLASASCATLNGAVIATDSGELFALFQ